MSQIFVLAIALASIVLLTLQPNKDGQQDNIINDLKLENAYIKDVVASIEMQANNSILLESGVCKVINNFGTVIPNVLINYKLYHNSVKSYIVFENTSFISITNNIFGSFSNCGFYSEYTYRLEFNIGGCTTDLTGNNFTIAKINNILWTRGLSVNFLKSEQQKIAIQNNTDSIFLDGWNGNKCNDNQIQLYYGSNRNLYLYPSPTNFTSAPYSNVFEFYIQTKNATTGFSITAPLMIFLQQSLIPFS